MATQVGVAVTATLVHRKAQSGCCSAPLDRVTPGVQEYTCRQCGQPAQRVHAEPAYHPAAGHGVLAVPDGTGGGEG